MNKRKLLRQHIVGLLTAAFPAAEVQGSRFTSISNPETGKLYISVFTRSGDATREDKRRNNYNIRGQLLIDLRIFADGEDNNIDDTTDDNIQAVLQAVESNIAKRSLTATDQNQALDGHVTDMEFLGLQDNEDGDSKSFCTVSVLSWNYLIFDRFQVPALTTGFDINVSIDPVQGVSNTARQTADGKIRETQDS